MKHLYTLLIGLLVLAPSAYAENSANNILMAPIQQSEMIVQGRVVDEGGEPLPGATVLEKGTSNGVVSDLSGNFSVTVAAEATLVVSFIGFVPAEIKVGSRTQLGEITMMADLSELSEVVVVGYGTQRKVDLTGSVAIVDTDEMKKISNSNVSSALQGKVAGVRITGDGQPGADPQIRIRGISSFGATNPLYVVDGVITDAIRDFSPNDIESVQILKDAASAAIYGAQAANGVVIITTKQGQKNQPLKVDYSGYVGVDEVPGGVYNVMNSEQYGRYINMAFTNSGMEVPNGYDPNSEDYIDPNVVNTDWQNEAFKTGVRQNHHLNLSGGGENNTYNLSLDYFKQEGTIVGSGPNLDRYTARLNNTMNVKFLTLKTGLVYSKSDQDNMALSNANEFVQGLYGAQFPVMASALITPPTIRAYDQSTWVLDNRISAASEYSYDSYGYGTYYDDIHGDLRITNVLLTNSLLKRNAKVDRLQGSANATIDFFKMLGIESSNHKFDYDLNLSYNTTGVKSLTFVPAFIQSTTNYLTKSNEMLTKSNVRIGMTLMENFLTYDGNFGRHHVNLVGGTAFQRRTSETVNAVGVNLTEPYFLQVDNALQTNADSYQEESVLWSYFGRMNYDFDQKYYLSATMRYDGSSRLTPEVNQDVFPAVSAGWRIDQENFFQVSKSLISLLKIRGSYGELGNISVLGPYGYMDVMARQDYTYSFGNTKVNGSARSDFNNEYLIWEKRRTIDVGLDLAMLNGTVDFTFDYYQAETEGGHYGIPIPAQAGFANESENFNASTMVNSGLEFTAAYHHDKGPVTFDVSANLTTLNNEVTKLGVNNLPRTDGNARTEVGQEIGQFYGYVYEGIFQNETEILNRVNSEGEAVIQNGAQPGDVAYADINNDGQITNEDQAYLGSGLPDFNFGFNISAQWKGLDLSVFAFGAGGFKVVDFVNVTLRSSYGALNKSVELLDAWTPENPSTTVPRVANRPNGDITNDAFSSRFIQDASYLRLANIQVGYTFPDKWFSNYVRNARLYVTGQNLVTFSQYVGYNVDFSGGLFTPGYNYASYPQPRVVTVGAQFSF